MQTEAIKTSWRRFFSFSPWLVVWVAALLGLAVLALSIRESEREKRKMIDSLTTRANALIWALEAGTRTWLGYDGDRNVLQMLLEETAGQPGVVYLAVADADGKILAHSDAAKVGESADLRDVGPLANLGEPKWRTIGEDVFEVYRRFAPIAGESASQDHGSHHGSMRGRGRMMMGRGRLSSLAKGESVVLVGLDRKPFQEAMREDLYNSVLTAAIVAGLGLAGVVSVFWAQNYRRSKQLLQREVERSERLAALGSLAAGVAHEIRNPLSTIKGLATYMAGKMPDGERERNAGRTMIQEIDRLNHVVSELLEFSRPDATGGAAANMNDIVARALRLADADIRGGGVTVDFRRDDSAPRAVVHPERFTQAFLNLFLNAVQAMPGGGALRVRVFAEKRNSAVTIAVEDEGQGITEEVRASMFNPYFTTKASGTGLGLAIVQRIVEGAGGTISVQSKVGEGTTFLISLPAGE